MRLRIPVLLLISVLTCYAGEAAAFRTHGLRNAGYHQLEAVGKSYMESLYRGRELLQCLVGMDYCPVESNTAVLEAPAAPGEA